MNTDCITCFNTIEPALLDEARMTRKGVVCVSCYRKKSRGEISVLPKHLRVCGVPSLGRTEPGRDVI